MSTLGTSAHTAREQTGSQPRNRMGRFAERAGAFVALTKPRVIELLLVTTIPTMFFAQRGLPAWDLMAWTLLGGALSAGSANAFNCYIDRDIDAKMDRTKNRPLVTGAVTPREALMFATVIGLLSLVILGVGVNLLSAGLSAAAILFYVFAYTMGLKRRTSSNIVWGGAAGCVPVLIGWAAVTGELSLAPWLLFLLIFLWTPPHYWPLSMKYADDYDAVNVPMLGAIASPAEVGQRIVVYSWAMVACSLALPFVSPAGWVYTGTAVVAGAVFLWEAHRLWRRAKRSQPTAPMRLFGYSITYVTLLFLALAVDPFVGPAVLG